MLKYFIENNIPEFSYNKGNDAVEYWKDYNPLRDTISASIRSKIKSLLSTIEMRMPYLEIYDNENDTPTKYLEDIPAETSANIHRIIQIEHLCLDYRELVTLLSRFRNSHTLDTIYGLLYCQFEIDDEDHSLINDMVDDCRSDQAYFEAYNNTMIPVIKELEAQSLYELFQKMDGYTEDLMKVFSRLKRGIQAILRQTENAFAEKLLPENITSTLNLEWNNAHEALGNKFRIIVESNVKVGKYTIDERIREAYKKTSKCRLYNDMINSGVELESIGVTNFLIETLQAESCCRYTQYQIKPDDIINFLGGIFEIVNLESIKCQEVCPINYFKTDIQSVPIDLSKQDKESKDKPIIDKDGIYESICTLLNRGAQSLRKGVDVETIKEVFSDLLFVIYDNKKQNEIQVKLWESLSQIDAQYKFDDLCLANFLYIIGYLIDKKIYKDSPLNIVRGMFSDLQDDKVRQEAYRSYIQRGRGAKTVVSVTLRNMIDAILEKSEK